MTKYSMGSDLPAMGGLTVAIRNRVTVPIRVGDTTCLDIDIVTFAGLPDFGEHIAMVAGNALWERSPLVRVHSECLTGDVFGSLRCDCGPQLRESLQMMSRAGGIVLYLRHEGRGIGLYNKLDAYALQDVGYDTYEANRALNFPEDMRDYRVAAEMLTALGVRSVRLLSNSPDKVRQLVDNGIEVREQLATSVFINEVNAEYLMAKLRHGHHLDLDRAKD